MRKLIAAVLVLATLYGSYWFIGRSQVQARLSEALTQVNASDLDLSYGTLATRGFPSRFDTTITDLAFGDPATGLEYRAPTLQMFALSYRPNEVIVVFPSEQTLTLEDETFTILSSDMRASGKVRASAALAFQTATIEADDLRVQTQQGEFVGIDSLLAAMRLTPQTTQTYDVFLEAQSIALPADIRQIIDPQNTQPETLQSLRFDSDMLLSAPIELNTDATQPIEIDGLNITEFALTWGDISISAIGDMTVGENGVLNGTVSVSARNWQDAIALAVSSGMIDEGRRFLVTEIANNMDETPHIADTVTVTLSITEGAMMLGAFPLGDAPVLR